MRGFARLIKIFVLFAACAAAAVFVADDKRVGAYRSGPPPAHTNAPGEGNCTECHFGSALNSNGGSVAITNLPTSYTPGQQVDVTVTVSFAGRSTFGFQLTAIDDSGKQAGTFTLTDANAMQIFEDSVNGNARSYVEHTSNGVTAQTPGKRSWTFTWTAPATNVGKVTFYAAGNAANGNFNSTGDNIYTTSAVVQAPTPTFTTVSAVHYRNEPVATESIVTGFGQDFAVAPGISATALPLPTVLAGVQVMVKDSAGTERAAPLYYVGPTQINYQIPPNTQTGTANVTVLKSGQTFAAGSVSIVSVAPGIFTANSQGSGVAAALVQRVHSDGSQSIEQMARFDPGTNRWVGIPIDLGPPGDLVFLQLYGTGIRNVGSAPVTAKIKGTDATVQGYAAHSIYVGLDQVNVLLPRSLVGAGEVDIVLTVGNKTTNTVTVTIQ